MRKRFRMTYRGEILPLTAAQRAYTYLYSARNDFLHGNRVKPRSLFVNENRALIDLTKVAPLLYAIALRCFLGIYEKRRRGNAVQVALEKIRESSNLERALIALSVPIEDWSST